MASPKTSTPNFWRGFTLIEMLIVIGIIVVLASAPLFIDLSSYRADAFRAEQSAIVTLLQKARADALNNIDEAPHGVAFFPADHPHSYVVFEGPSYASSTPQSREVTDQNYALTFGASSPGEIVFNQLDASTNFNGDVILVDSQRSATTTISVNREGGISW